MKILHLSKLYIVPLALLVLIATPSWAASKKSANENFATMQAYGNSVYWSIHPSVHFASIKLTLLSSAGALIEVESGGEPSTPALDDGNYNYELIVTPLLSPSVRAELKAARKAADGQETGNAIRALKSQGILLKHRQVQSGFFRILNGQLVSADAAQE